jgi:hypothetical protein
VVAARRQSSEVKHAGPSIADPGDPSRKTWETHFADFHSRGTGIDIGASREE